MYRSLLACVIVALISAACSGSATTTNAPAAVESVPFAETDLSRVMFLDGLDDAGWATYMDKTAGWSVRYPGGWTVGDATEPGRRLTLMTPSATASLVVVLVENSAPDDSSSWDYLDRNARAAVESGAVRPAGDEALSLVHLDVDFDGRYDLQDIVGVDLVLTSDAEGTSFSEGAGFTSWFAYYDPDAVPRYAYSFETVGQDPDLIRYADGIVFSFEPPGGYPVLPSTAVVVGDPLFSLGEEVAVVDTALGTVTWRQASSIPLDLVQGQAFPDPSHRWADSWLALYEDAQEATGSCFEIFEVPAGYLGLGPCAADWLPQQSWYVESFGGPRIWEPQDRKWAWMNEVWFSLDGKLWNQTTKAFPDSTAAVAAEPWSVAEKDGRWVVIGATGVSRDAETPLEDRTQTERRIAEKSFNSGGLDVPRSAGPAAWVSDDLAFGWKQVFMDFAEEGTDTQLTSVVAGELGWAIFGIRTSQESPGVVEWVAWTSTDGIGWQELPMVGVLDAPCQSTPQQHCGVIKAHLLDDAIVAFAWTWPPADEHHEFIAWRLLIGAFE